MQSLELANDELDYIQLNFPGDVTDFEEEVEVCDGEGEVDNLETQTVENQAADSPESNEVLLTEQFCLHQKLEELFQQESYKNTIHPPFQNLRRTSCLLEKLVEREQLNMVILMLQPPNKGYGLFVCTSEGIFKESRQPYSQDLLLDYIDNEELPPPFLHYWEQRFPQLFYSGCVIAQVKDLRYGLPGETRHVLLRPHTQSLINDVNLITMEENRLLTMEERLGLESALVNTVQGPLCLDPSPFVGLRRLHIHRTKNCFNVKPFKGAVGKQSQVELSRKRKMEQCAVLCNPNLANFINSKMKRSRASLYRSDLMPKDNTETEVIRLTNDTELREVCRLARAIDRPPESSECTPQLVEQYILETERPPDTTYHIKLSILQRPSNCEYLGHLYFDKEYKEGESNGSSCRFSLGTRARANNYIEQFTEVFTEEGRKSVKITHLIPGQPARISYTAGMIEREAAKGTSNLRLNNNPKQKILQVLGTKPSPQIKAQKPQKEIMSGVNITLNGLLSSFASASGSHQSNGNLLNGDLPSSPVSSPSSPQVSKASLLSNPAISALANSFRNSVQQYQQAAAAAAANTYPASCVTTSVSTIVATTTTSAATNNTAILTLLNNTTSSNSQTLNQLLNPPQQQKLVARKMTITNLLNSRLKSSLSNCPNTTSSNSTSLRIPLSTLAGQLTSPPQNVNISNSGMSPVQQTISVHTLSSNSVRPLKQGSVQTLSNIQTLTNNLPSVSGVQSLGNIQAIQRLSGTKETTTTNSVGQNVPTSNLGLSMPGLSALLAGTPSAEDPSPVDRLNNSSQSGNLNLASLQASMASIPALQNVQISCLKQKGGMEGREHT